MKLDIYQVDAFTSTPFAGNPAGVCITQQSLDEEVMFKIAEEMAVPETAFLTLDDMRLRWFSPIVEVQLCGHGTLAAAHIMKELGMLAVDETLTFHTLSGPLLVKAQEQKIEIELPTPTMDYSITLSKAILDALGIKPDQVVANARFESTKLLIEIENIEDIFLLSPNFDELKKLPGRAIVITAKNDGRSIKDVENIDFISRNFAPWVGVNEDPVTGSAHCALAVHWGEKLNKTCLTGFQASARGGFVKVEQQEKERIRLTGSAVTTIKGTMNL